MKIIYGAYKNELLGGIRSKKTVSRASFYNDLIEKPRIKRLKNIDLIHELPFYDELSIVKISQVFKRYARSYKIEIIDSKRSFGSIRS